MMRYPTAHIITVLLLSLLVTLSSHACRCFHRYYLYSIFHSEQMAKYGTVECNDRIRAEDVPDNQMVSLISYPSPQGGKQPSNYGEVYSYPLECRLVIDNQVVIEPYTELNDKQKCDREIIEACKALKSKQGSKWPSAKPRPSSGQDHLKFEQLEKKFKFAPIPFVLRRCVTGAAIW